MKHAFLVVLACGIGYFGWLALPDDARQSLRAGVRRHWLPVSAFLFVVMACLIAAFYFSAINLL